MRRFLILLQVTFLACSQPTTRPEAEERSTSRTVAIEGLYGDWLDIQDSGRTYVHEHWELGADGTPSGLGYVLSGNDTVFIEHLALLTLRDTLHYAVSVGSQGGPAVLFKLIHDQDSLVFVNPQHDMPQRIVYTPAGPDAWLAIVSGTHQGETAVDHYHFKRVKRIEPILE